MNLSQFSGFVLAGGKSSRMQTDKAFLEIGSETFLERAVKILRSVSENRVKIVLNRAQSDFVGRLPVGVAAVFDVYENRGALGGIHAALSDCATEYALVLAVDLPFVTIEAIENLAKIALSSDELNAVVPRQFDGRVQPLCAGYRVRNCLPALENLMAENERASVRDFLKLVTPRYVEQRQLTADDGGDIFFNVNYPADFQSIA